MKKQWMALAITSLIIVIFFLLFFVLQLIYDVRQRLTVLETQGISVSQGNE